MINGLSSRNFPVSYIKWYCEGPREEVRSNADSARKLVIEYPVVCDAQGCWLFDPRRRTSPAVFEEQSLSAKFKQYRAQDVQSIFDLAVCTYPDPAL
jgi:hypothetical protein